MVEKVCIESAGETGDQNTRKKNRNPAPRRRLKCIIKPSLVAELAEIWYNDKTR